jgi:hypothetical protein
MTHVCTTTLRAIRSYLGHNGAECVVRITRDGCVLRYGSPALTDRRADYWQDLGPLSDYREPAPVVVTYRPDADARDLLRTYGPAVDRRCREIVRAMRRYLGRGWFVRLDLHTNRRCTGATMQLHVSACGYPSDLEDTAYSALCAAWDVCALRWESP